MATPLRFFALTVVLAVTLSSCAGRAFLSWDLPAASPAELAGTWEGVITGAELSTAMGRQDVPARLIVDPDGHWTLVMRSGSSEQKASGTFDATGNWISLEGTMPGAASAPVYFELLRTDPHSLYGSADTLLGGRRVQTGIQLRKTG
jgi:hypothetical protein